ncbi:hypothetical protein, partial [Staphylococcus pseudintermedius]|uniref:hypothetical protein n=1 Tax=Staphylococcus pseudintermedius TaxID=283734 RepID=UPI001C6ED496
MKLMNTLMPVVRNEKMSRARFISLGLFAFFVAVGTIILVAACRPEDFDAELYYDLENRANTSCTSQADCPFYLACVDAICTPRCRYGGSWCPNNEV